MEWPGNSHNLNQIENLWSPIKNNLEEDYIKNDPDLKKKVLDYWCLILNQEDYLQKILASMPRRLEAVINNGGGHAKY